MRYFLIYLTANDMFSLSIDYLNIKNLIQYKAFEKKFEKNSETKITIKLILVMSLVKKLNFLQRKELYKLIDLIQQNSHIFDLQQVILKGNIGRDFSSVYCALNYLKDYLYPNPDDIVLIRNRSAYGAFKNGWFSDYINVLNHPKNNDVAIVGNTINIYARDQNKKICPHIQTYLYAAKWRDLDLLLAKNIFPGLKAKTNHEAIKYGELKLSDIFLNTFAKKIMALCPQNLKVSKNLTLQQINELNQENNKDNLNLQISLKDIKSNNDYVANLPFKYKFPQYRRNINALCGRISFALKSCLFNYQKNFKLSKNEKNIISKISEFDE